MKVFRRAAKLFVPGVVLAGISCGSAYAQAPVVAAVAAPIVINTIKPKSTNSGLAKFEGTVMNANTAQITVRAKGDDMSIHTFTLSKQASTKMQTIIDRGGYQFGDKVTVLYDPTSLKAMKVKGKPSPPL
jgi:hypothetical protein